MARIAPLEIPSQEGCKKIQLGQEKKGETPDR